jgi:hypothetical protein
MKNIQPQIFIRMINLRNNTKKSSNSVKSTIYFNIALIQIDIENNIDRLIDSVRNNIGYGKYK